LRGGAIPALRGKAIDVKLPFEFGFGSQGRGGGLHKLERLRLGMQLNFGNGRATGAWAAFGAGCEGMARGGAGGGSEQFCRPSP